MCTACSSIPSRLPITIITEEQSMIASAVWKKEAIFEGRSESGHTITMDTSKEHVAGPSPYGGSARRAMRLAPQLMWSSILEKKNVEPITD